MMKFSAPSARVLVVDDIKTNLEVVKGALSLYGIRVDTCLGGIEAIRLARVNNYDLILMDYMMPEMDGIEAVMRIRFAGGTCRTVPIIAHTSNVMTGTKEMLLRSGFSDFLSKPMDMDKLGALLEKWIPIKKQKPAQEKIEYYKEIGMSAAIEGVDIETGLARVGGEASVYLRTLMIFGGDGREKAVKIKKNVDEGDLRLFVINVHALKSAAGNIGAIALSESAKALEAAGKDGDWEFIRKNTPRLLADLEALLRGIDEAVSEARKQRSNIVVDKEAVKATLAALNAAIDRLEPDAINAAAGELRRLGIVAEFGSAVEIILHKTLIGEYDEAVSLIETLLRQKA